LQGESRKHGILHMVVAFDRKVENGEDSVADKLINDSVPFPYRFAALFVEVR
jgi:hypothetical protein